MNKVHIVDLHTGQIIVELEMKQVLNVGDLIEITQIKDFGTLEIIRKKLVITESDMFYILITKKQK